MLPLILNAFITPSGKWRLFLKTAYSYRDPARTMGVKLLIVGYMIMGVKLLTEHSIIYLSVYLSN